MKEPNRNVIATCTMLVGSDHERIEQVAEVLRGLSDRITIHILPSGEKDMSMSPDCRLVVLTDAEPSTMAQLDLIVQSADSTLLKLACLSPGDVEEAIPHLLGKVDDILLHPDELELRLPFLEQRLVIREKSELQNRAILETIVDGIVTIDSDGIIKSFNPSAERIFGYKASEAIGRSVNMLMPPPHSHEHHSYIERYEETGKAHIIGIGREVVGIRKGGDRFPMDLAVGEIYADGQKLYTGVIRDVTERRELELEILRISDQERRRIGQDLHDGLGQMLTGIGLISQSLVGRLEREESNHVDDMIEVTELIKEADRSARTLARGLVPVELDEQGLENALEMLVKSVERMFGISCTVRRSGSFMSRDSNVTTNLYRIAQESVSNAIKHGKAENVEILLRSSPRKIEMIIRDDGIGFPETPPQDRGMGVPIMKYRARVIGASLEIQPGPEGGTRVSCILSV